MTYQEFITTSRGLKRDLPPFRLYEKAKRFGIWNPGDIDLSQFQKRVERLEKARGATLAEIYRVTGQIIDENDG